MIEEALRTKLIKYFPCKRCTMRMEIPMHLAGDEIDAELHAQRAHEDGDGYLCYMCWEYQQSPTIPDMVKDIHQKIELFIFCREKPCEEIMHFNLCGALPSPRRFDQVAKAAIKAGWTVKLEGKEHKAYCPKHSPKTHTVSWIDEDRRMSMAMGIPLDEKKQ